MPTADFLKFQQFTKVEESKDGTVVVWGIATEQKPDLDNEVCSYEDAVPVYKKWSDDAAKRTKKAGQDISLGPIRLQHGLEIGGKATKLTFDDDEKAIYLGSVPLNAQIKDDLHSGFYTGYSQGGSYAWRKCSDCGKSLTLAQASNWCPDCKKNVTVLYGLKRLSEVSYVDSPCSGVGFEYVKANGSREIIKFAKRGDGDMPVEQVTEEARYKEFAKKRKAARKTLLDAVNNAAEAKSLKHDWVEKSLYEVSELARLLNNFAFTYQNAVFERDIEGDESDVPDQLKDILDSMVEAFIAMAEEEARELAAAMGTDKTSKLNEGGSMTPEETAAAETAAKAAQAAELAKKKGMAHHFAKSAAHHEKMQAHHEKMAASHETMHDACKADVGDETGNSAVAEAPYYKAAGVHHKAMMAHHEKCGKCHMAMADHCHAMSESHDAEEHAKTVKAIKEADLAAGADPAPVAKTAPSLDTDVAAEMAKQRTSPEYKQALTDLAKAKLDEELQALREKTLAPDGVKLAGANGADGIRVVPRAAEKEGDFKFAATGTGPSSTGL